jgi:hypothetical protein
VKYLCSTVIGLLSLFVTYHIYLKKGRHVQDVLNFVCVCVCARAREREREIKKQLPPIFHIYYGQILCLVCVDSVGPRVWSLPVNIPFYYCALVFFFIHLCQHIAHGDDFFVVLVELLGISNLSSEVPHFLKYHIFCHYQHRCIEVSILNTVLPVSVSFHLVIVQFF